LISATIPSNNNIDFEKKNNVHPTEMLLKIMLECGVRKIIYFSSGGAIYGNQNDIIIFENATCNPLSTYGKGKKMIEELIQSDAINKGLQAVILRPSNIYGAQFNNEGKQGLINTLLNNCLNDVTTEIWGNGSVVRDYIHIDDIVLLLEKIISNFVPGVYNVGSGIGYSVNEIFKIAAQVIDKPIERTNKENQANAPSNVVLDIQKIKKTFDFEPSIPIELGIKKTWEYYLLASKIS
jgi:UDP-glucose 4-epimerase